MISSTARRPLSWTTAAPLLCSLHCLATPLAVAAAPSFAPDDRVELLLLVATIGVASLAAWMGIRAHGRAAVLLPVVAGLLVWGQSLRGALEPLPETVTTVAAALTVAGGLFWNARLRHLTGCSTCGRTGSPSSETHDQRA